MARATVSMHLGHSGGSLAVISRELRRMDGRQVTTIFRQRLDVAARSYPMRIRAAALAIPVKPEGRHTGLRARIAGCVSYSSGIDLTGQEPKAYASLWIDPRKMEPDYKTLPLYMEGVREKVGRDNRGYSRWRHPVFGDREVWRGQPSHPFFYPPADPFGRAADAAIREALGDITRKLNG